MFLNIIKSYRDIVAICDEELLGKKFEEGKFQLDIKENFYKGKEVDVESLIEIMKKMSAEDATFNIVGKKSVNAALKTGIISEEGIGKISGIPFALILS
jgi:hypothetical protein